MARFVNVAGVLFSTRTQRGAKDAGKIVLEETRKELEALKGYGLDLVVLSEGIGAVGQTPETAEEIKDPGPFLKLFSEFASAEKCHVAGCVKTRKDSRVYNSIVYVDPGGFVLGVYNKTFVTDGELEQGITSGKGAVVVDSAIGRLGGIICFDLNFERLRGEYKALNPDILTFASMYHGGLMQSMWAYDCRSYFVCAWQHEGEGILDPFGRTVKATDCYSNAARAAINLDRVMVHLDFNREKFPEIEKKYLGRVVIDIPPNIGSALIFSIADDITAMDIVKEFELELLDDYFDRSVKGNDKNRKEE